MSTSDARSGMAALEIGEEVSFSKTVGESDVYLFAGITGDLFKYHINEEEMRKTRFGARIAHGALLVGFMSTASSLMIDRVGGMPVSYGYDRIRFTAPVFLGDTVTVTYKIAAIESERSQSLADVTVTNQDGDTVAIATHILKFL